MPCTNRQLWIAGFLPAGSSTTDMRITEIDKSMYETHVCTYPSVLHCTVGSASDHTPDRI